MQYRTGYAIYGALAFWGICVPLLIHRIRPNRLGYPTLFATVRTLGDKRPVLAAIVLAGLVVLAIHLVLYPWPSLSRESVDYAGLSRDDANNEAQAMVASDLFRTSDVRGRIQADYDGDGDDDDVQAWLIHFNVADFPDNSPRANERGDCVVAVWTTKSGSTESKASAACK